MTLPTKIITRLKNIGNEVSTKINNRISDHNSSEEAHSTLFNGYVKKVDKSNHTHGQITADGKITTQTNNTSKVVVTESDGTVKVIERVPQNNVVHQDISGKLNKNQGSNNVGKFMKVQSSGELEPEEVTVPNLDIRQTKTNGVEIASINGTKLYCNENTTYSNATTSLPGLMSSQDKTKLDNISEGADSVSFNRILNEGDEIGTLTINGVPTKIYCNSTHIISDATPQVHGLMSTSDKVKLNGISEGANKTEFTRILSSGTKIGTLKLDNQSIDLYCVTPTVYTGKDGINITDGSKIGHSNSIDPRTTGSLCKIKYDSQGHITEGIAIDTDVLYATKSHNHDTEYSKLNHRHVSGWRDEIFTNGETTYSYCGITFYTKVNEDLGLGMLGCYGTVTCKFNSSSQRDYDLSHQLAGYYPNAAYRIPIHSTLNLYMVVSTSGKITLISESSDQRNKTVSGAILYLMKDNWW